MPSSSSIFVPLVPIRLYSNPFEHAWYFCFPKCNLQTAPCDLGELASRRLCTRLHACCHAHAVAAAQAAAPIATAYRTSRWRQARQLAGVVNRDASLCPMEWGSVTCAPHPAQLRYTTRALGGLRVGARGGRSCNATHVPGCPPVCRMAVKRSPLHGICACMPHSLLPRRAPPAPLAPHLAALRLALPCIAAGRGSVARFCQAAAAEAPRAVCAARRMLRGVAVIQQAAQWEHVVGLGGAAGAARGADRRGVGHADSGVGAAGGLGACVLPAAVGAGLAEIDDDAAAAAQRVVGE